MKRNSYAKCSVIRCREEHSSLHQPPTSEDTRVRWINFIFDGKIPARVSKKLFVCAGHFSPDSFTNLGQFKAGLAKKLWLKEGSIPTVRFRNTAEEKKVRSRKRHRQQTLSGCQQPAPADVASGGEPSGTAAITEEADDEPPDQLTQQSTGTSKQVASVRNVACQTGPLKTCTARTQLHLGAHLKSTDTQKTGSPTESQDMRKETSSSRQKSYIVSESCLLELFEVCPVCKRLSDVRTRRFGAFLSVEQRCPRCQFSRKWNNQPVPGSHPAENLPLSAAVYLTGCSFLKLEKIFQTMQLKMLHSVQRDARLYVEPEILHRWKSAQDGEFELQNLILGGDFREDAPDVQQLLVIKEELPCLDQQDPEPVYIKEEEEELWTSQESEINGFTFTGVAVKNDGGEDEARSSRLLQIKTEDNREAEPPTSGSAPEPARNPDPNSHLQPNTDEKALKVFETDVSIDDDDAWQEPWSDSEPDGGDAASETNSFADVCVEETTRRGNLSRNSSARTAENRFACSICTKVFTRLVDLRRHRRVHPEDKPLDCDLCGKKFRMERALKGHMRIHTGEKAFSCDVCGRSFMNRYILTSHKKIHGRERPFGCGICGRKYSTKTHFKRHTMVHTGEKPFSCDVCGKRFSQDHVVRRHLLIHREEEAFCCGVCGKRFKQQDKLKRHVTLH